MVRVLRPCSPHVATSGPPGVCEEGLACDCLQRRATHPIAENKEQSGRSRPAGGHHMVRRSALEAVRSRADALSKGRRRRMLPDPRCSPLAGVLVDSAVVGFRHGQDHCLRSRADGWRARSQMVDAVARRRSWHSSGPELPPTLRTSPDLGDRVGGVRSPRPQSPRRGFMSRCGPVRR
jgi:hypothetical protein